MIEKIVVSRKIGPAVTALNVAAKLELETGGWLEEDDPELRAAFGLRRVAKTSPSAGLEQSVSDSHGTLYFTQTKENGASLRFENLKRCALRLNRPLLPVHLDAESGFSASRMIAGWIAENEIRVLHVDGNCGDQAEDASCKRIAAILEAAYFFGMTQSSLSTPVKTVAGPGRMTQTDLPPETVEAALDHLETGMALKDKAAVANMSFVELAALDTTLGGYILKHFDLFTESSKLLADCRRRSGPGAIAPDHAAAVIIEKLWERLRATCRIRVVK